MQSRSLQGQSCCRPDGSSQQIFEGLSRRWLVPAMLAVLCTILVGAAEGGWSESRRERVSRLVIEIQRADYEGNRAALKRLYQDLAPFANDKKLGAGVGYWRGFAMWRSALNGFNDSVDRGELVEDLKQAVREFESAITKDPAFTDAKAAAGSSLGTILWLSQEKDQTRARETLRKALAYLEEAEAAEPENPRVLWVLGQVRWSMPTERGGGQEKAIETNLKGLKAAREHKNARRDPLIPAWGEPELLMNLAWDNLNRKTPDLDAADHYAQSALALVPYWHYVKDILIPQIAAARSKRQ